MKSILIAFLFLLACGLPIQAQTAASPETIRIYVSGAIVKTGSYDVPLKMAFVDAILQAGGPTATANLRNIKIYRPSDPENGSVKPKFVTTVDYKSIIDGTGDMPEMKNGDVIIVSLRVVNYTEQPGTASPPPK